MISYNEDAHTHRHQPWISRNYRVYLCLNLFITTEVIALFNRYKNIGRRRKDFFMKPEEFPQKPFNPVPFYSPSNLAADSKPQPLYTKIVCLEKNNKIFSCNSLSLLPYRDKIRIFKDPFSLGKRILPHHLFVLIVGESLFLPLALLRFISRLPLGVAILVRNP